MPHGIYSEPSKVSGKRGKVRVKGPDAVDVEMTPEAAMETAARLEEAAIAAKGEESWRK